LAEGRYTLWNSAIYARHTASVPAWRDRGVLSHFVTTSAEAKVLSAIPENCGTKE
jgi:hypothetical protein